jgi:hypothetical protein
MNILADVQSQPWKALTGQLCWPVDGIAVDDKHPFADSLGPPTASELIPNFMSTKQYIGSRMFKSS